MTYEMMAAVLAAALFLGGCAGSGAERAASSDRPAAAQAVSASQKESSQSERLYEEALAAYQKGEKEGALSLADRALREDPENYRALSLKGLVIAFVSSPEEGIQWIGKALALQPDYVQGWYDMAMAQKLSGHYDESIRYFQKVLEKDPANTWSYYGIATNYADKRDKVEALRYLKKALQLDREAVRPAAAGQDHFQWLHGDPDFEALLQ